MKRTIYLSPKQNANSHFIIFALLLLNLAFINAQDVPSITGKLIDQKSNQPVPYANIGLFKASDAALICGSISNEKGEFKIGPVPTGNYRLLVSVIGYKLINLDIDVVTNGITNIGNLFLEDTSIMMKETVVVGERTRAKSETGKTTFFTTKKMIDASVTGIDVLKFIPGIQTDLAQNIALEGSQNILILVDGKERDKSYVSQLNPNQIEKVEVISRPVSNYDGNVTGAINIVMKKEKNSGIDGQIHVEIPTSASEIFIKPNFSLNYGFKKLNLYTSYSGDLTYFNLHESYIRKEWTPSDSSIIITNQYVRQKEWSHRFNYGFDYFLNSSNQLNFYAYYNPYSRELDGNTDFQISGNKNESRKGTKEDTDINTGSFYSLYYKHSFRKKDREITFDISHYTLKADNSTEFIYTGESGNTTLQINSVNPRQNETSFKMDYTSLLWDKLNFSTGVKAKFKLLRDRNLTNFNYNEDLVAAYGNIVYKAAKYDLSAGLRAEKANLKTENTTQKQIISFFPSVSFKYKLSSRQNIQFVYNRTIKRPDIYQLNPAISYDDPNTLSKGNPFLKPEYFSSISIEHSVQFKSNYFATRLFGNKFNNVINNLMFINDTGAFETQVQNMGTIQQVGIQFSGTLKLGIVSINPYLRLFEQYLHANGPAKLYVAENASNLVFASGISAIVSFKHDFSFSLIYQYASPQNNIQDNSYCDALYFLSLEKTIKQKIKISVVSAIPFTKTFTYSGSDINGPDFYSHYKGDLQMSGSRFWFTVSYQFNSGKSRDRINRTREEPDVLPKKGF
jgi:hypothetical protein